MLNRNADAALTANDQRSLRYGVESYRTGEPWDADYDALPEGAQVAYEHGRHGAADIIAAGIGLPSDPTVEEIEAAIAEASAL